MNAPQMYPKGWNEALSGLVREFLREPFARENGLAVFSLEKVGEILENVEEGDTVTPELQQSVERCKALYGELLFAMEAEGIPGDLVNSVRELSQWRESLNEPELDSENTGSIDMREERKKFLTAEKLSAFSGGDVDDVEKWLKDQVSLPCPTEESTEMPFINSQESPSADALEVSHGTIRVCAPVEQGESMEEVSLSETSEFSLPDLAPQADRPVMRLVPPSHYSEEPLAPQTKTEAFSPTPAAPPLLSTLPPTPETTAGDYLSLAAHFHQTTQGFETVLPPGQAERLEVQSLCLAVSAANDPKSRAALALFFSSRVELLSIVTEINHLPATLLTNVIDSLDSLALARKMTVPWAALTQTLRFLSKANAQSFEPSLMDTACLLLLFGHDSAQESHPFSNVLGVVHLEAMETLRLGLVLLQLQRYKTRSLSHTADWKEDEVNRVRHLVEEALAGLEKIEFAGVTPHRAQGA